MFVLRPSLLLFLLAGVPALSAGSHQHPSNTPAMAQHYGHGTPRVSPLTDMQHKQFRIEPFKGHWTLLYYWADWCMPCVREGIPQLIAFANSHQQDRAEFRIVAIRFNSIHEAGDWNTFHAVTEKLEKEVWHAVPRFPLVYDESMQMTKDWGIHELPTYALVDADGNLVPGGSLDKLRVVIEHRHPAR